MANPRRGEVEAVLDGRRRTLVLTLGALAELEAAFGAADLMALAERFAAGRLAARDAAAILAAGLRGAGEEIAAEEVAAMRIEGGAVGAARLVNALLAATFGAGDPAGSAPPRPTPPQQD
ncbi:gene transfer agent family protein [Aquabacter spiritensis]|uniref:Tail tube GTA-gp10-like protein n=1 Tax=Aquabacter spiritensis TaxID=933073 RepID=A0A4R3M4W4_9HYPH|nr:gene transfer agent family protein [Aquabacter spiritensis]TCT07623.1 tail tube GTA-gp10-like protein [Aquabacter spiritensis]